MHNELLPSLVASFTGVRQRAVWLVPTLDFQTAYYPRRGSWVKGIVNQCADPDVALNNWMARDIAFGRWVLHEVERLNLTGITVDGSQSIPDTAIKVACLFDLV